MTSGRTEPVERVRLLGAAAALTGGIALLAYPYHQFFHYGAFGSDHEWISLLWITWPLWATMVPWGVTTMIRGTTRSLTPPWAAIATPLVAMPAAVLTYRAPVTDVSPASAYIRNWESPAGLVDTGARMLAETSFAFLGAPIFLILGVAWARDQRGWFVLGLLWLLLYSVLRGAVDEAILQWLFAGPFSAAILGAFLFYGGYRFAAETGDDGEQLGQSGHATVDADG